MKLLSIISFLVFGAVASAHCGKGCAADKEAAAAEAKTDCKKDCDKCEAKEEKKTDCKKDCDKCEETAEKKKKCCGKCKGKGEEKEHKHTEGEPH